jgi:hypothetical protein
MQHLNFLDGVLLTLMPSMIAVAWLAWRAGVTE